MSSFHYIASEKQEFEVEAMGDHEHLVRVHGADEDAFAGYPDFRTALAG
jgi:hypothetical protein